jgi:hypothetical protein
VWGECQTVPSGYMGSPNINIDFAMLWTLWQRKQKVFVLGVHIAFLSWNELGPRLTTENSLGLLQNLCWVYILLSCHEMS